MSEKPYRWSIDDSGTVHYFVNEQEVDHFDYQRATFAWEREQKALEVDTRGEKPLGVYITKQFPDGVYNPQLATHPRQKTNGDPAARFYSFKDLDRKALANGMAVNPRRD